VNSMVNVKEKLTILGFTKMTVRHISGGQESALQ